MNVYDFDKTIYSKDTTAQFYLWALKKWPRIAKRWPPLVAAAVRMGLGKYDKTAFKSQLFLFLRDIPDPAREIELFWDENIRLIHKWFLAEDHRDDVVITASPLDFVKPACRRLGIERVMGSPVDIETGLYHGVNCHGEEKVRVFREAFPGARIEKFFSDSHSDDPLARMADKAYLVKGEKVVDWPGKNNE